MKTEYTQQEIILNTDAGFFNRPLCAKDTDSTGTPASPKMETLENHCWAGILIDILPELMPLSSEKRYLWQTIPGKHFLKVNMGSCPPSFEHVTSIDPYFFLSVSNFN